MGDRVSALPTASAIYQGRPMTLLGSSLVADKVYVCLKNSLNNYYWAQITTS